MAIAASKHVTHIRIANKAQLAEFFGIQLGTIDAWIRKGCPYRQRGSHGVPWEFDLLEVARWHYATPTETKVDNPDDMTPRDRLSWYRGSRERTKHLSELGDLIPVQKFESELATVLKGMATFLDTLPDVLERDASLSGPVVGHLQKAVDQAREYLFQRLSALLGE